MCNARSALNAVIHLQGHKDLSRHPLVRRFFKGVFNVRPPPMKPQYTWDPGLLLEYIENLGDNDGLDLKTLSLKLTALLMLLSGNRVHCVHSLSTEDMHRTARVYTFYPTVLLKHSRTKFRGKPLTYKAYPRHKNLCVYTTLDAYINRTSTIKTSLALLVTHRKPLGKAQ